MSIRTGVLLAVGLLAGCGTTSKLEHPAPRGYRPDVPVTVAYAPARSLPKICTLPPDRLVGCSLLWPGERCEIYVAEGLDPRLTREVLRHETAHCGGWTHE